MTFFRGGGAAILKTSGEGQYLSDDRNIFMMFKMSFSDAKASVKMNASILNERVT